MELLPKKIGRWWFIERSSDKMLCTVPKLIYPLSENHYLLAVKYRNYKSQNICKKVIGRLLKSQKFKIE